MRNLPSAIKIYFNIGIIFISYSKIEAQISTGPTIISQQCYGGSFVDFFTDAIPLKDGNIISTINPFSTDGDLDGQAFPPGWILKFNEDLEIEFEKFYNNDPCAFSFYQVSELIDSALIFSGYGGSNCDDYVGDTDLSLLKTNKNGEYIWKHLYGSPGTETFNDLLATEDGGYILSGWTYGSGGDIPYHYGAGINTDAVVFKLDSIGEIQWVKVLGGSDNDSPVSNIIETATGIYQIHIGSYSTDYDLAGSEEGEKKWIVVFNNLGEIIKENILNAEEDIKNYAGEIIKYKEGTLIINGGNATSTYYPTIPTHAGSEGAIAYIDSNLEINFMKQWGGSGEDIFLKHVRDTKGNFYFLGVSTSSDGDLMANNGSSDYWILCTDSNFNQLWSKNFGGSYLYGEQGGSTAFNGSILIKENLLYCFISCIVPDSLPDYDIGCGHPSLIAGYATSDAWVVVFDLNTVEIKEEVEEKEFAEIYAQNETIFIQLKTNEETQINIYNLLGEKIYTEKINANTTEIKLKETGIFIIELLSGDKKMVKKVFIE